MYIQKCAHIISAIQWTKDKFFIKLCVFKSQQKLVFPASNLKKKSLKIKRKIAWDIKNKLKNWQWDRK